MKRSAKDVLAGLAFVGFGVAFAAGASTYTIGSPVRMGPGFFPLLVGGLLVVLGGIIVLKPAADPDATPLTRPPMRATVLILGAIVVFGLTVRGLGLVPSVFIAALMSALASRQIKPVGALLLAVGLTVISVLVFVVGLRLNLPLLGPWISF